MVLARGALGERVIWERFRLYPIQPCTRLSIPYLQPTTAQIEGSSVNIVSSDRVAMEIAGRNIWIHKGVRIGNCFRKLPPKIASENCFRELLPSPVSKRYHNRQLCQGN